MRFLLVYVIMKQLKQSMAILKAKCVQFGRQTTIHGVPILVAGQLHFLERLFWLIGLVLSSTAAVNLAVRNVQRYYANPTVVSIQKDYRNWFNPFPGATACFANKADDYLVHKYIEATWGINETHSQYQYYRRFVKSVANVSYNTLGELAKFGSDKTLNGINLFDLAAKVHPDLTGTQVTFDMQQTTDWRLVMTELGVCFSVNTKIAKYFILGSNYFVSNSSFDHNYIHHCHYLNGLCYARYDSDPELALKIYIHSYLEIAHATSAEPLHVNENQEIEISYKMQQTSANAKLRSLSPIQRKCRFDDEPLTNDLPAYSTSICYMLCRYRLVLKLCGCRPFFYHTLSGRPCTLLQMACVARHSKHITKSPVELECHCPPPCDFVKYLPQVPKVTVWEYGYFDQRLTFRWGLLPPTTKYHRDIIFGFEDLVGGTLALFLGVSFITAFEIIFFIIELTITFIY